jgi:hypothetical protein
MNLLETLQKATEAGIKFNPEKCKIKQQKIEYFGHIVSPKGVISCHKKVKAIMEMPAPTNKQELQSFLGTINFLATHIPNLSKHTYLMRGLMKKDTHFIWTNDMTQEFNDIKNLIAKSIELVHFDPNKPAIIETDASVKGLGAVLIQD